MKKLYFIIFTIIIKIGICQEQSLKLLSGEFLLEKNIESLKQSDLTALDEFENYFLGIIQFEQLPNSNEKQKISEKGIRLLKYLPEKAFFVAIDKSTKLAEIKNLYSVNGIHKIMPEYKLHPKLKSGTYSTVADKWFSQCVG